jgi:hypothetical protein
MSTPHSGHNRPVLYDSSPIPPTDPNQSRPMYVHCGTILSPHFGQVIVSGPAPSPADPASAFPHEPQNRDSSSQAASHLAQ